MVVTWSPHVGLCSGSGVEDCCKIVLADRMAAGTVGIEVNCCRMGQRFAAATASGRACPDRAFRVTVEDKEAEFRLLIALVPADFLLIPIIFVFRECEIPNCFSSLTFLIPFLNSRMLNLTLNCC